MCSILLILVTFLAYIIGDGSTVVVASPVADTDDSASAITVTDDAVIVTDDTDISMVSDAVTDACTVGIAAFADILLLLPSLVLAVFYKAK